MKKIIVTKAMLMAEAERVVDLVIRKNADYGDAWQRFGPFTPLIRLNDKLLRVQTLADGREALVTDEAIEDTVEDIIGYSLLLLSWLGFNRPMKQLPLFNAEFVIQSLHTEEDSEDNTDDA